MLFGVACFLAVGVVPRLSLSMASDLETTGAAVLFLGLVMLAFAAGAFRPWRESTAMGAYRFWSGAPIGGSVLCPVCEAPNEKGTPYCVRCGRELPPAT